MNTQSTFPEYVTVDYTLGRGESAADYPSLVDRLGRGVEVVREALSTYERPAVLWTGGKDSSLVLSLVQQVCAEDGHPVPPVVFIDHYGHFPEVLAFVERWADEWDLDVVYARNDDPAFERYELGEEIPVSELTERSRRELTRTEFEGETFTFTADSLEGNHLLKTVAMNDAVTEYGFDALFSGVRWDEQEARADETFFSPRHDAEKYPPHDRVHPILQFDERTLWDAMWGYVVPDAVDGWPEGYVPESTEDLAGFAVEDLPVSPKYFEGFRSLGTEDGSAKSANAPAWLQDLDGTTERAGRAQDKEGLMERLRDLGYM